MNKNRPMLTTKVWYAIIWLACSTSLVASELAVPLQPSTANHQTSAEESFFVHAESIFQVRIMNASSKSQSALGSGFFVGDGTLLATNYHVVSSVVLEPEKYSAEIDMADKSLALQVIAIDVINDLAILSVPAKATPLALSKQPPARGARLYSIGNPLNIGMTVIEGNYNGLVENRFFDRIHFSGAVNSGMSGGPALNANGEVVGVNVASAGNQVGFLVPVNSLNALLSKVESTLMSTHSNINAEITAETAPADKTVAIVLERVTPANEAPIENPFYADIAQQIQSATHYMIDELLAKPWPTEELADAIVIGKTHDAIDCWGDSAEDKKQKMKMVQKGCNSRDGIFISHRLNSGYIEYEFSYSEGEDWPVTAFYQRMSRDYALASPGNKAGKKDVGNFTCVNQIIGREPSKNTGEPQGQADATEEYEENAGDLNSPETPTNGQNGFIESDKTADFKRKASFCTRAYKKLPGIFDAFYLAVTLEKENKVLMEHFTLSGVSKEDGQRFLSRFIGQVSWQ